MPTPYSANVLNPLVFDHVFYAKHNPDLAAAGLTTKAQLEAHWVSHGAKEGRKGCASFNARGYINRNPGYVPEFDEWILYRAAQHFIVRGSTIGLNGGA
jgi:hypothetical protein